MKPSVLMSWIGNADLAGPEGRIYKGKVLNGPVWQALKEKDFSHAFLVSDVSRKPQNTDTYLNWIKDQFSEKQIDVHRVALSSPVSFSEIYGAATAALRKLSDIFPEKNFSNISLSFDLSPGTPVMAAVWVFLSKTHYPADLIISSEHEKGVQSIVLPFDIAIDYSPDLAIKQETQGISSAPEAFKDIIYKSSSMKKVIQTAEKFAQHDKVPILILGETGTGKEILAKAIHSLSPRSKGPFLAINCGAIPEELLESELFGYEKGAHSKADKQKRGVLRMQIKELFFLMKLAK